MKNFRDLELKKSYIVHGEENFVDSLLNPALEIAKVYRRTAGFFSSSVFRLLMDSLPSFIRNGGKIYMIVSPELSKEDIEAIQTGYKRKSDLLCDKFIEDIDDKIRQYDDVCLDTLETLIENGIMDIKVAAVKNDKIGIYHDKLGILTDKDGNNIVFVGSANESYNAYNNNYEKERITCSWVEGSEGAVEDEIAEFDRLWEDKNEFLNVYNFMDSVKECIIKEAKERENVRAEEDKSVKPVTLYDYQSDAIEKWVANGYNGFYVMATGTGKTWTAIYAAKRLIEDHPCLIVIAAPYKHLIKQWEEDVRKAFGDADIVLISSENPDWETLSRQYIIAQKYDTENKKQVILITTIKSFNSERFNSVIGSSDQEKLLIVDEAHRFNRRNPELHEVYKYMLGLSATPMNGKDVTSGQELVNFFGGQVFSLQIEDAMERGILVPYNYYPIFVCASDAEEKKFNECSAKMASCYNAFGKLVDEENLIKYSRSRLRVLSMAQNKIVGVPEFIEEIQDKDHFIVYCGDGHLFEEERGEEVRHIQYVIDCLTRLGFKTSRFTATESMGERMRLVNMFNKNLISSLVAIRCLDEGINIPSIKSALILSSNDSYREFVQRRGRILRRYEGKTEASIYDVIVLPSGLTSAMAKIELRRYYEYAHLALNSRELLDRLDELLANYNLTLDDVKFYTELDTEGEMDD